MPKWLQILETVGLAIMPFTPAAPLTPFVIGGIQLAEQIPGATGEQKKAVALQIVALGAQATNAAANKQVIDPAAAQATAAATINTIVGVTNLVHQASADAAGPGA